MLSICNQLLIQLCNIFTYSTDYKMKSILHVWNSCRPSTNPNITPVLAYGLLCWLTGVALEIEGCRGKEPACNFA
nr:MAG TPA: hypothetical protein [Caudoviricetes sp.]